MNSYLNLLQCSILVSYFTYAFQSLSLIIDHPELLAPRVLQRLQGHISTQGAATLVQQAELQLQREVEGGPDSKMRLQRISKLPNHAWI